MEKLKDVSKEAVEKTTKQAYVNVLENIAPLYKSNTSIGRVCHLLHVYKQSELALATSY